MHRWWWSWTFPSTKVHLGFGSHLRILIERQVARRHVMLFTSRRQRPSRTPLTQRCIDAHFLNRNPAHANHCSSTSTRIMFRRPSTRIIFRRPPSDLKSGHRRTSTHRSLRVHRWWRSCSFPSTKVHKGLGSHLRILIERQVARRRVMLFTSRNNVLQQRLWRNAAPASTF